MTNKEAAKLLVLIKAAYPNSYRDMDDESKRGSVKATVLMWQTAFPDVPYTIMEMAFNQFRMNSKFPPTVAEMWDEIERLHWRAIDGLLFAEQSLLLTHDSLMNIIEHLKDYSGTTTTKTLTIHADAKARLTDEEKAIATQKGWTIA